MSVMCESYNLSGASSFPSHADMANDVPPKASELFGEAALTLAVPLVLAILVSFVLPIAGFAVP